MGFIIRSVQKTKLPNGKKPSYEDLEASFIATYDKLQVAQKEIKRLNMIVVNLKHDLKG